MLRRRRGFFLEDVVIGLALLVIIATVLAVAASRQNSAARSFSDSRAATRLAENALLALQSGTAHPLPAGVEVQRLEDLSPVARMQWVQVSAQVEGRRATLLGLAPVARGGRP